MAIEQTRESKIYRISKLARHFRVADIYAFGSRAKEIAAKLKGEEYREQTRTSDVDIGIRPLRDIRLRARDSVNITIELEDILEAQRVDLVLLTDADPFLALDIIRGELLYSEDPADQARYELFVLRRAGDLSPFKKERIKMIFEGHGR